MSRFRYEYAVFTVLPKKKMNELERKYREDRLSGDELRLLRKQVNAQSDEEIEHTLREVWMEDDFRTNDSEEFSAHMEKLKSRIDQQIQTPTSFWTTARRIMRVAAMLLLPLFIAFTVYLYIENNRMNSEEMIVSTGKGERANITLPDGTAVSLNAESELAYTPKAYNKDKRLIRFDGEGYFQVAANRDCPFLIDAEGLKVEVLGTTFNLNVRRQSATAELALESGSVHFLSIKTGRSIVLSPNEKVILNQENGDFIVERKEDIQNSSAWKRGELIFNNAPFDSLLHTIEHNYGIQIETDYAADDNDRFTGTLPASNLYETLEILKKVYHLDASSEGDSVRLSAR